MEKATKEENIIGGLMGASSYIAMFSFFQLILHLTKWSNRSFCCSLIYMVPMFVISLPVWIYTLYKARLLKKKRESEKADKIQ